MATSTADWIEELKGISVLELSERIKALEEEFGVSATAVAAAAPAAGGGGQPMPDGTKPEPGGWNRFMLEVADLEATVEALREAGSRFRNDIVEGVGGKQILLEDPSGNPIELFQPILPEASLANRSS